MNQEIKAKWVAALRSGEYKQIQEHLRTENGYCCLGVLCELHRKEVGGDGWGEDGRYLDSEGTLPRAVALWADIPRMRDLESVPDDVWLNINGKERWASAHNDGNKYMFIERAPVPFTQIADAIEAQL